MSKIRLIHNLMIAGTVASLFAVSALADNAAPGGEPASAPAQRFDTVQTLGTLRKDEIQSPQPEPANKDVPMGSAGSGPQSGAPLQPVHNGDVVYVTGGIGDEERNALHEMAKDYNLRVMSAEKNGQFLGDARIVIRDRQGVALVDADAGPIFYAHLPAGTYNVEVSSDGQTKKQRVTVGAHNTSSLHFGWP